MKMFTDKSVLTIGKNIKPFSIGIPSKQVVYENKNPKFLDADLSVPLCFEYRNYFQIVSILDFSILKFAKSDFKKTRATLYTILNVKAKRRYSKLSLAFFILENFTFKNVKNKILSERSEFILFSV